MAADPPLSHLVLAAASVADDLGFVALADLRTALGEVAGDTVTWPAASRPWATGRSQATASPRRYLISRSGWPGAGPQHARRSLTSWSPPTPAGPAGTSK